MEPRWGRGHVGPRKGKGSSLNGGIGKSYWFSLSPKARRNLKADQAGKASTDSVRPTQIRAFQ